MNDKKRLNAEQPKPIRQGDVDAWKRGKDDAKRNQILKNLGSVSPEKAISIVRMFADSGDEQFIRTKLSVSISDIRKVLSSFGVKSIEDARSIVNNGIIHELDAAKAEAQQEATNTQRASEIEQSQRLKVHEQTFNDKPKLTSEEKDLKLRDMRDEAFRKNKADKIKSLIAEGIQPQKASGFQIDFKDVTTFKSMIPYGVSQLQRRFGGSKKDIVQEIKRLSPGTDTDMLRP